MAEVNTRSDIEAEIADTLNRTNLTTQVTRWFNRAHNSIQRLKDWRAQELTQYETLVSKMVQFKTTGTSIYCGPANLKKPRLLYTWDPTANNNKGGAIRFYAETSIDTLRVKRNETSPQIAVSVPITSLTVGDDVTVYYALWNGDIHLWPDVGSNLDGKQLRFDFYAWLDAPAGEGNDWFTTYCRDYLVYRSLRYASLYIPGDPRIQEWKAAEEEAKRDVMNLDTDSQWSGELVMRG